MAEENEEDELEEPEDSPEAAFLDALNERGFTEEHYRRAVKLIREADAESIFMVMGHDVSRANSWFWHLEIMFLSKRSSPSGKSN